MFYEIQPPLSQFPALDCPFPEALAVIQGHNPGWLFVDHPDTPHTALVWAQGIQGFYLLGDVRRTPFLDALNDLINQVLASRLHSLGVTWFEISGGEHWDATIERIFGHRQLERGQQWVYTLPPGKSQAMIQPESLSNSRLLHIDGQLLAKFPAGEADFLHDKLELFWGSQEAFLRAGLGYVLVRGSEIASLCCSAFVAGDTHVIDIETVATQRRQGYALAVARAFITACIERSLQPYWDCMAENVASARLAEKLGFTRSWVYSLYSFSLKD